MVKLRRDISCLRWGPTDVVTCAKTRQPKAHNFSCVLQKPLFYQ